MLDFKNLTFSIGMAKRGRHLASFWPRPQGEGEFSEFFVTEGGILPFPPPLVMCDQEQEHSKTMYLGQV